METYDDHILAMQDIEGFLVQFYSFCKHYRTQEESYEATESMFFTYFKRRRFKDYNSFRQRRTAYLKRICKKGKKK